MSMSAGFLPQAVTANLAALVASSVSYQWTDPNEKLADSLRIFNSTNGVAWVSTGKGAAPTAVIGTGTPVPPSTQAGQITFMRIPPTHDYIAVILATGATPGPVYVQRGDGGGS